MCVLGGGDGGFAQKAETRITSPSVKKDEGGVTSCDIKQSKNVFVANMIKKKQFHRSFSVNFISLNASAND